MDRNYEKITGFIDVESLRDESDEFMDGHAGVTPTVSVATGIVTGVVTGVVSNFIFPTTACTSSC
jgi:hypothetical protein